MLIEFIAFVVTMLILIYMTGKRANEERKKMQDPAYVKKQQDTKRKLIKEFERALEIEEEEDFRELPLPPSEEPEPKPAPKFEPPKPKYRERKNYGFTPALSEYRPTSPIEKRNLTPAITEESIRIGDEPVVSYDLTFADKEAYQINLTEISTKIRNEINDLSSRQKMLIYHMILEKPKAFQQEKFHEYPFLD